jgi:hypothetical protein
MVQLSVTRCSCIAILWVGLVSFAAITLCVASEQVIPKVSLNFVIDSVRKLLDTLSYLYLTCSTENTVHRANQLVHHTEDRHVAGSTPCFICWVPHFRIYSRWKFSWFYSNLQDFLDPSYNSLISEIFRGFTQNSKGIPWSVVQFFDQRGFSWFHSSVRNSFKILCLCNPQHFSWLYSDLQELS